MGTSTGNILDVKPPALGPVVYGYVFDEVSFQVYAAKIHKDVSLATEEFLKLIRCSHDSDMPCKSGKCRCVSRYIF